MAANFTKKEKSNQTALIHTVESEKKRFATVHARRAREEALAEIYALEKITKQYVADVSDLLTYIIMLNFWMPEFFGAVSSYGRLYEKRLSRYYQSYEEDLLTYPQYAEKMEKIYDHYLIGFTQISKKFPHLLLRTKPELYAYIQAKHRQMVINITIIALTLKFPLRRLVAFVARKFFDSSLQLSLKENLSLLPPVNCLDITNIETAVQKITASQRKSNERLRFFSSWAKRAKWLLMVYFVLRFAQDDEHSLQPPPNILLAAILAYVNLVIMIPSLAYEKYRECNFESKFWGKLALLKSITNIPAFEHSWSSHKQAALQLSSFTLRINEYKSLNLYIICQTIKNALLRNGILFTAGKISITIDADVAISKKMAQTLHTQIAGALQRLLSIPKLECQMRTLIGAIGGSSATPLFGMITKASDGLPLKRFCVAIPQQCRAVFADKTRLTTLFAGNYTLAEDALFITGYQPFDKNLFNKLINAIYAGKREVNALYPASIPSAASASSILKEEAERKRAPRRQPAPSIPPAEAPLPPRIISWGRGCTYNSAHNSAKIIPFQPGIFFNLSRASADVKEAVQRGKIVTGLGQQGIRFFNHQNRAQWGGDVIGDIKFLGKGGKGEMRALISAKQSTTGETLLEVGEAKKIKH
jgi:hypothetical protein